MNRSSSGGNLRSRLSIGASQKNVRFGGHVSEILEQYQKGNDSNYVLFLNQLKDPLLKSSQLVEWVQQCTQLAHALDKEQNQIVNALLKVRWMEREAAVISAFQSFIIALVSSNPVHMRPVVKALTCCFIPVVKVESGVREISGDEKVYETAHFIMKTLLKLIPQASSIVTEVFQKNFPYMTKPVAVLEWYTKNLLYASTYLPHLRTEILQLIMKYVAEIDVHTPRREIQDAEDDGDSGDSDEDATMFKMDEDVSMNDESDEMKLPLAKTLDHLMVILLQYVKDFCYVHGEFQLLGANKLLNELLKIFDKTILPLHDLVHTQFVIFYMCSFKQSFCEVFIKHCWNKVTDPSMPAVLRQASVCYIASLVARAKFVPLKLATECLDTMVSWAHGYMEKTVDSTAFDSFSCHIGRHSTFYSVCQAIFYVLVFRHKQILDNKRGHSYLIGLNLHPLITSPLNPLKACLSSVVSMFTSTMRTHQILYCDTIVERNNRVILPVVGSQTSALGNPNPLECFFPFDPYLLKRSSVYIDNLYQEWEGRLPHTDQPMADNEEEIELIGSLSKSLSSPLAPGFSQLISTTPF